MKLTFFANKKTDSEYALHTQMLFERVKILYQRLIVSFPANLFCATIILIGLYGGISTTLLLDWYTAVIVISLVRLLFIRWWRKSMQNPRLHLIYFLIFTWLSASTWGFAGYFLMPYDDLLRQMLVIIVIAGVTAGALQSLQASLAASIGYAILAISPLILSMGSHSEGLYTLLSLAMTAYLALTCILALNGFKLIQEVLLLRFKSSEDSAFQAAILESASDCVVTINENNEIISTNKQTEYEFEYTAQELKQQNITKLLPSFNSSLAEFRSEEYDGVGKMGNTIPLELKTSNVTIKNERIIILIMRNIAERRRLEKLKTDFISTVSHELRTPLTSIKGSLSIILGGATGTIADKSKKMLNIALNNCERLLLIINDILDLNKLEAGKIEFHIKTVDLAVLVEESITANKMYAEKYGVRLDFTTPQAHINVKADPDRVMQVLANLISNAVKFSPEGESVVVAICDVNGMGRVSVSNKGPGIPLEFQSKIFQRFEQAHKGDAHGGTGLGLSISHTIIEKMNGVLKFTSEPNVLTTFYFDLPGG